MTSISGWLAGWLTRSLLPLAPPACLVTPFIQQEDLEIYVKLINGVDFDEAFHSNLATGWDKLQKEFNKDGKVRRSSSKPSQPAERKP